MTKHGIISLLSQSIDFKTESERRRKPIHASKQNGRKALTLTHLETKVKILFSHTGNNSIIAAISLFRTHLGFSYLAFSAFPKQSGDLSLQRLRVLYHVARIALQAGEDIHRYLFCFVSINLENIVRGF